MTSLSWLQRMRAAYRAFVRRHIVAPDPHQPRMDPGPRIRDVVIRTPRGWEHGFRVRAHNEYEAAEILWFRYLDLRPARSSRTW